MFFFDSVGALYLSISIEDLQAIHQDRLDRVHPIGPTMAAVPVPFTVGDEAKMALLDQFETGELFEELVLFEKHPNAYWMLTGFSRAVKLLLSK